MKTVLRHSSKLLKHVFEVLFLTIKKIVDVYFFRNEQTTIFIYWEVFSATTPRTLTVYNKNLTNFSRVISTTISTMTNQMVAERAFTELQQIIRKSIFKINHFSSIQFSFYFFLYIY